MKEQNKAKIKLSAKISGGIAGGAVLGFINGAGVDHILADKIIYSMKSGDIRGTLAFVAIFLLIWLQVKGLRNEMKEVRLALTDPEAPIALSFAKGETRMNTIEEKHAHDQRVTEATFQEHEHRITILEEFHKSQGGKI